MSIPTPAPFVWASRAASGRAARALLVVFAAAALSVACGDDGTTDEPTNNTTTAPTDCESDFDCADNLFCVEGSCVASGDECFSNADCDAGFDCDNGYCVEADKECEDDAACSDGQICEDFACVTGCREDAACPDGQVCDDATSTCVTPPPECPETCPQHQFCDEDTTDAQCVPDGTCTGDNDCVSPDVCNEGECGPPVIPCDRNADCPDGTVCDPFEMRCLPGCRNSGECSADAICVDGQCTTEAPECDADANEPDNTDADATFLAGDTTVSDSTLCGDSDWYSFEAFEGDDISLTLSFIHDNGNLNLRLFQPDGELLQLAGGQEDGEVIQRPVNVTGLYTVEVFAANRDTYTEYDLIYQRQRNCPADANEPNNVPGQATALELESSFEGLFACENDPDWFVVELFPGETLTATLAFAHDEGDLRMELYDADAQEIEVVDTDGDQEVLTYTAQERETVYVAVPGVPDVVNLYDLTTTVDVPECAPDGFEGNDTQADAASVGFGDTIDGTLCAGDEDWFALDLLADVQVDLGWSVSDGTAPLELEVLAEDGRGGTFAVELEETDSGWTFTAARPGAHWIRIGSEGRYQSGYTLELSSPTPLTACPDDDGFEDNDTFDTAAPLDAGVYPALSLCTDDNDWYSFELAEGQSAEVYVLAALASGEIHLALYGPDATSADDATLQLIDGDADVKRVRVQVGGAPGVYRVGVVNVDTNKPNYSLRHFVYDGPLPLDCEFDDGFEDNDTRADATDLPDGASVEAIVCGANADWFRFDATAGEVLNVRADFFHRDGDLNLALIGADDSVLAAADSETDDELLTWTAEADGPVWLRVNLANGEGGARYDLTVSRAAGEPELFCPSDDGFEENDTVAEAAVIDSPGVVPAAACGADADYYAVTVEPDTTLWASLIHGAAADALTLELLSTDGDVIDTAPASGQPARRLTVNDAGDYVIAVNAGAPDAAVPYTLYLNPIDGDPTFCGAPDAGEPNTAPSDATVIDEAAELDNLGLCGDDEDWFRIDVPEGVQAVVEADFDGAAGDLDLFAFGAAGGNIASSTSTLDSERIVLPTARGGASYFVLAARGEDETSDQDLRYDLTVSYEEATFACFPDEFDPNDTGDVSVLLAAGVYDNLSLCEADTEDWYYVETPFLEPALITVRVDIDDPSANLDLQFTDAFIGFPLGDSMSMTQTEELSFQSDFGGPLRIRVYNVGPETGSTYSMEITVE